MKRISCVFLILWLAIPFYLLAQTPIRVVCIGNSITAGSGLSNPATMAYPVQLKNLLGSNYTVLNCGVSGRTMLKKGDYPYWNEAKYLEAKNYDPQIVIISLGTNDSKPQNWKYKSEFYSDYKAMIEEFRAGGKTPHIFVCFPPPAFSSIYNISNSVISTEIIPLIDSLRTAMGTSLIDYYHAMLPYQSYFSDGVHPTEQGAIIMAQTAYQLVMSSTGGVLNSNFEVDNAAVQTPNGWTTRSSNRAEESDFVDKGNAYNGNYKLTHWNSKAYCVYTYQTISGLTNGNYTLKAWVRSSGGQNSCVMTANKYGGDSLHVNLPTTGTWTQITIPHIPVANGQCVIGFSSNAPANAWCNVDGVEFPKDIESGTNDIRIGTEGRDLKIYPSPTKDFITIEVNNLENSKIQIFDINGREVYQSFPIENKQLTINTHGLLNSGVYVVKAVGINKTLTKTLIVE